jgi:hypothetical protein
MYASTSSAGVGVWGTGWYGVYGYAPTYSSSVGVYGAAPYHYSYGVYGVAYDDTATTGVYGYGGNSSSASLCAGIFGETSGTTANGCYAGNFNGYISKSGTAFLIDHPLDPADKWLAHWGVESPDMMNVYNGIVTTDKNGEAEVQMPSYFEALNTDYRYQLTPIGGPAPNLHVKAEIRGGRFLIGGSNPSQRISWQVTGVRQDAYAKWNPPFVEQDKHQDHKGLYKHPEAHKQPAEKGIQWSRKQRDKTPRQ